MLIISNIPQDEINPRTNTNHPEKRHSLILQKLSPFEQRTIFVDYNETNYDMDRLKTIIKHVHHPSLIDFLHDAYTSFEKYPDKTYPCINGIIPYNFIRTTLTDAIIEKTKNIVTWKKIGMFCDDSVTPIFKNTWYTALNSTMNGVYAAELIKNNMCPEDVILCLNIYPGHHSGYNKYGGYCFLNNAMIAAFCLSNEYVDGAITPINDKKVNVGILDIDYHAGNGTADILKFHQTNSNILFQNICCVSIHANPEYDYPFMEGYRDDYQNKNILNIPFEPNTKIEQYMKHLDEAITFLKKHDINYLIIAFGGDTYKNDPDVSEIAKCGLDIEDYFEIGEYIKKSFDSILCKIIVTQEGGYNLDHIDEIVQSFLIGLQKFK